MTANSANDNIFDTNANMKFIVNNSITFSNNCQIDSNSYVGSIEMFYSDKLPPNYLLCNGQQISNVSNANPQYQNLIDLLTGSTGNSSAYLPDFSGCIPFGWKGTFNNYNTDGTTNQHGNNSIDIHYFPSHNHSVSSLNCSINIQYDINYSINSVHIDDPIQTLNVSDIDHPNKNKKGTGNSNLAAGDQGTNSHTHNIVYSDNNSLTNGSISNLNITKSITTGNNITSNQNIDLTLSSYKLFFGIRFK